MSQTLVQYLCVILRLAAVIRAFVKDTSSLVPLPICCIHDSVCGLGVSDLTRIPDDAVHGESGEPQTQWVLWHEMKPHPPPTHTHTICCLLPVGLLPALRGRGSWEDLAFLVLWLCRRVWFFHGLHLPLFCSPDSFYFCV